MNINNFINICDYAQRKNLPIITNHNDLWLIERWVVQRNIDWSSTTAKYSYKKVSNWIFITQAFYGISLIIINTYSS